MGYRYNDPTEKGGESDFRMMEIVTMRKKNNEKGITSTQALLVDNHWDTLRYVQEHMDNFVDNVIKVKKMETTDKKRMEESAKLFEDNLESLFTMISKTSKSGTLEKLSISLKKALILMAMDRYQCDRMQMCNALGITPAKLEEEIIHCGLGKLDRAA